MILETNESIKIELRQSNYGDDTVLIQIDSIDYAVIKNIGIDDLDLDSVVSWIDNTYYDGDYKSEQYIPCELNGDEFR